MSIRRSGDTTPRFVAIDWSGAASAPAQRRHIVVADYNAGQCILSSGRSREQTISWLIEQAGRTPSLVVGIDFAFSCPGWFVQQQGADTVEEFWAIVEQQGEEWLATCAHPFWGKRLTSGGGRACPTNHRAPGWSGYRVAERLVHPTPKSPFQVGGAGAVGTGSLRGMPSLLRLRKVGFSIWPFHPPALPMVMEMYPRTFTGPVRKSSREARMTFLQTNLSGELDAVSLQNALQSEDAFDAVCSAVGMKRQAPEIAGLQQATDSTTLLEGLIFPGLPMGPGHPVAPGRPHVAPAL